MGGEAADLEKRLYDVALTGDVKAFQPLLQADPNLLDRVSYVYCPRSITPLHIATQQGNLGIVEEVLKRNPQLAKLVDSQKSSPLHIAAAEGYVEIASMLLSAAPNMCWLRDCHGMNPVHVAAVNGNVEILRNLIRKEALAAREKVDGGQTVLHLCVKHGQLKALEFLVERLGNHLVWAKDDKGNTILHLAVRCYQIQGNLGIVKEVLNINPQLAQQLDSQNSSPLHIAAAEGNIETASLLLSADLNMCGKLDQHGMNPIHIAAMNGHVEILRKLIEVEPCPAREKVDGGQTVLHLCVKHGQLNALELLVEISGDELVCAEDYEDDTILHLAVRCYQIQIIRYLVNINIIKRINVNSKGKTALNILQEIPPDKKTSIEEILRQIPPDDKTTSLEIPPDDKTTSLEIPSDKRKTSRIKETLSSWKSLKASSHSLDKFREIGLLIAVLIATMAFQAVVSPPGGVWQEDSSTHRAGAAVMAYTHPKIYKHFVRANTVAFASSLLTIFLHTTRLASVHVLVPVAVLHTMWVSLASIAVSYGACLVVTTPNTQTQSPGYVIGTLALSLIGLFWFSTIGLFLFRKCTRGNDLRKIMIDMLTSKLN